MYRLLPLLALAFKLWMAIDAGRKRQPYYWFMIIFFVPLGEVVYFFVVKIDDFKWRKLKNFFRSLPTVDQLKLRYRESPSIDNRMALARALADAGRHVEAIVELEGLLSSRPEEKDALWRLALSRAALGELEQAQAVLTRLVTGNPSYADWEPWVMLAGIQHKRGLGAESLETMRTLVRRSSRAEHQMLLAEALIATEQHGEAAAQLDRIVEGHEQAPDYIRRRDRKVAARARRLREDMRRAGARAARTAAGP